MAKLYKMFSWFDQRKPLSKIIYLSFRIDDLDWVMHVLVFAHSLLWIMKLLELIKGKIALKTIKAETKLSLETKKKDQALKKMKNRK